jgi:hypothetical protein
MLSIEDCSYFSEEVNLATCILTILLSLNLDHFRKIITTIVALECHFETKIWPFEFWLSR